MLFSAESLFSLITVVDIDCGLLDQVQREVVALFIAQGPVDEPVLPENYALELRAPFADTLKFQAQLEAGAQPWRPANLGAEYLLRQLLRAPGCGHGDHGVGMHVVDVRIG